MDQVHTKGKGREEAHQLSGLAREIYGTHSHKQPDGSRNDQNRIIGIEEAGEHGCAQKPCGDVVGSEPGKPYAQGAQTVAKKPPFTVFCFCMHMLTNIGGYYIKNTEPKEGIAAVYIGKIVDIRQIAGNAEDTQQGAAADFMQPFIHGGNHGVEEWGNGVHEKIGGDEPVLLRNHYKPAFNQGGDGETAQINRRCHIQHHRIKRHLQPNRQNTLQLELGCALEISCQQYKAVHSHQREGINKIAKEPVDCAGS